tara:strand:+ start:5075 stop:5431 length:357 start_codon:yes stop_codon:yes gene_type:complete
MPMRVFAACHADPDLWMACIDGTESGIPWQIRVDLVFLLWLKYDTSDTDVAEEAANRVMQNPSRHSIRTWRIRHKKGQMEVYAPTRRHIVSTWLVEFAHFNRIQSSLTDVGDRASRGL